MTSYLILFGEGRITSLYFSRLLVIGYIASNLFLTFLPQKWFYDVKFFYSLIIIDTGILLLGMVLSERVTTDFYLVFFLVIIFASMSRDFKMLIAVGGVTGLLYGVLLYSWGLLSSSSSTTYTLRIPFIFIITAFYGYIVQTFLKEKHREFAISEDKYRGLFENANDGIIIVRHPQLHIADANREAAKAIGYTKEELLHKGIFELFGPLEKGKGSAYFDEVLNKGEARTDSFSLRRKDGTPLEMDLSCKRIDLGDESFYQMIFRDLTEQRTLEKKIGENKRNLEAIFDSIPDQLSIQAPDLEILRVNRAVEEAHRRPYQDLLGRKCYEAYYQRSGPCEGCPVAVTIESKQPASAVMKHLVPDTILRIFSYPILDEKGNLLSVIEHVQDITDEQRFQEQLIRSEKLAGVGILASGVAHAINNPLSGIMGMAEIAMEEAPSPIKGHLKDIVTCSERIAEIVRGLSSHSRMAKKEDQTLVALPEVLEDSLKMISMVSRVQVEVIRNYQPVERMEANLGEIQLVFNHLLTNAFDAMKGREGRLVLSTRSLKDGTELKVSDNGVGIPQKYLKQIFDPFFTTKNPGEGIGLGLNIGYRIVSKYGGVIDVESKEDVGTTFTIRFPVRREG